MNTIINQFFAKAEVKTALKIAEINSAKKSMANGQKKKFAASLELAKLVSNASEWFDSNKVLMTEEGVTLKKEEFFETLFGFQKSFAYRLNRVAKIDESVVEEFTALCDSQEREGKPSDRSLTALEKFSKGELGNGEEGEEGEGEGESKGETILTLSFKRKLTNPEESNVSVRVDSNGRPTTTNTREEIEFAIAFLRASLEN